MGNIVFNRQNSSHRGERSQIFNPGDGSRSPAGFCPCPILFVLYTTELMDLIHAHDLDSHAYADDTQLYFHSPPDQVSLLVPRLLTYISDIDRWLSSNRLQLNQQKTEFIWLASPHHLSNL